MPSIRRTTIALAVVGALGAAPAAASASTLITISGATSSYPLVALLAAKYRKVDKDKVRFKITQGGASVGIADVAAGRVTIGDSSRDPLPTDPTGLDFYPIAKYAICVVTNESNPLSNLTTAQVDSIFTGKTRNWSEVPGAKASGPIDLISRTSTAGVLTSFETLFLSGSKPSSLAAQESSEGLLKKQVENDDNSIGFLSNYNADSGGVSSTPYNGVACTRANAASEAYAGLARFYEVTKGKAAGAAAGFISWIDKSAVAKKIISSQWVPISEK
ncbi:MAG TPA: substrate-binding domain-containing protein [Solirubrobacteraceae bacterium]|jgi:phosphate transport system substrate-binding protein